MIRNFIFFILLAMSSPTLLAGYGAPSSAPSQPSSLPKYTSPSGSTVNLQSLATQALLPADFPVYTDGKTVINHPMPGFAKKTLPTNNDFIQTPGCYVACYSHNNTGSAVYPVSQDIYAYGQVRVPGSYEGRICKPTGYENIDISGDPAFKTLCATKISTCQANQCWAGGDTGGWFGL